MTNNDSLEAIIEPMVTDGYPELVVDGGHHQLLRSPETFTLSVAVNQRRTDVTSLARISTGDRAGADQLVQWLGWDHNQALFKIATKL